MGCGPAGEARYPAYPEGDRRWRFPGVGEFQCYDKYMLEHLAETAEDHGEPHWGYGGPHDAGADSFNISSCSGLSSKCLTNVLQFQSPHIAAVFVLRVPPMCNGIQVSILCTRICNAGSECISDIDAGGYCSRAEHTGFFHPESGRYESDYGQFFLDWYAERLEAHVRDMLSVASKVCKLQVLSACPLLALLCRPDSLQRIWRHILCFVICHRQRELVCMMRCASGESAFVRRRCSTRVASGARCGRRRGQAAAAAAYTPLTALTAWTRPLPVTTPTPPAAAAQAAAARTALKAARVVSTTAAQTAVAVLPV